MDHHPDVSSAEYTEHDLPEAICARYVIEDRIGRGSMGVVYRAYDTRLDRSVALKALPPASRGEDTRQLEVRFLREARLAARLIHPSIVTIYDILHEDDRWFLVMELLEGLTFRQVLHDQEKVAPEQARAWVAQAARALDVAHRAGVVHRDIKPENLLVQADGRVRIMDFGIAVAAGQPRLTRDGWMMGTPAYLAPELLNGGRPDPRSDLFALGIVLYELIAGVNPYAGGSVTDILKRIIAAPPPALSEQCSGVSPRLAAVVDRLLRFNPSDRYASAAELVMELEAAGGGLWSAPPVPPLQVVSLWAVDAPGSLSSMDPRTSGPRPIPSTDGPGTVPLPDGVTAALEDTLSRGQLDALDPVGHSQAGALGQTAISRPLDTTPLGHATSGARVTGPTLAGRTVLESTVTGPTLTGRPTQAPPRRGRWGRSALAASLAAVGATVSLGVWWWGHRAPAAHDVALTPVVVSTSEARVHTAGTTAPPIVDGLGMNGKGVPDSPADETVVPDNVAVAALEPLEPSDAGGHSGGPSASKGGVGEEPNRLQGPSPLEMAQARANGSSGCAKQGRVQEQMACLEASLTSLPKGVSVPRRSQVLLMTLLEEEPVRQRGLALAPKVIPEKELTVRMQQWLVKRDFSRRMAAAETLALLGRPVPESQLRRLDLSDSSCPVRKEAALYFVEHPSPEARADLERALERSVSVRDEPVTSVLRHVKKTKKVKTLHCDHEALVEALAALPRK